MREVEITHQRQYGLAQAVLAQVSIGMVLGGTGLVVAGVLTSPWLFIGAGGLFATAGLLMAVRKVVAVAEARHRLGRASGRAGVAHHAHIGLGATVHSSATIEPGALIEMGATVRSNAKVETGAVIRMGATVEQGATVEKGAVIGWGATVALGARVGEGASVGAGATVGRNAVLRAGGHLGAGATLAASKNAPPPHTPQSPPDPRAEEFDALCNRLESELAKISPELRAFLGTDEKTLRTLRKTWLELLERENALRRELTPELMSRLERERTALTERIAAADDEQVRRSLTDALAALEEQRTQRERLGRSADRLDAELTRLRWSTESLISQLVQVRTQGGAARTPELEHGLDRVREELLAVTEALESMDREEREGLRSVPERVASHEVTSSVPPPRVKG